MVSPGDVNRKHKGVRIINGKPKVVEIVNGHITKIIGDYKAPGTAGYADIQYANDTTKEKSSSENVALPLVHTSDMTSQSSSRIEKRMHRSQSAKKEQQGQQEKEQQGQQEKEQQEQTSQSKDVQRKDTDEKTPADKQITPLQPSQATPDKDMTTANIETANIHTDIKDKDVEHGTSQKQHIAKVSEQSKKEPITKVPEYNVKISEGPNMADSVSKQKDVKVSGVYQPQAKSVIGDEIPKELGLMDSQEEISEKIIEKVLNKQRLKENLEQAARFALESKDKIEGIDGEIKHIEGRLGEVNKSVTDLCTGVDCIKNDVKKTQETQEQLQKSMQERFKELGERIKALEETTYICDNCGANKIRPLDSFCPNCGSPISNWSDESGNPIPGWVPYWKRVGRVAVK